MAPAGTGAKQVMRSGNLQRALFTLPLLLFAFACTGWLLPAADQAKLLVQPSKTRRSKKALKTRQRPIQVDVNVVLVTVTVTDPLNRLVTGLEKEHFRVFENKREQEVQHFSSEDVPISLGVVFDASGSMSNKMGKSRMAALEFFKSANPKDEFFLVDFNDRPRLMSDFTTRVEDIQDQLVFTKAKGRTALLDAIYLAMNHMRHARHRKKAALIISDGGDNSSRYSGNEVKSLVREADIQIYAIGIYSPYHSRGTTEEMSGPGLLNDLTQATGGRQFPVDNLNELPDVAAKISLELRNQYVLGYVSTNRVKDGKWRKIKVKLSPPRGLPRLRVHAKTGYYAPTE